MTFKFDKTRIKYDVQMRRKGPVTFVFFIENNLPNILFRHEVRFIDRERDRERKRERESIFHP